MMRIVLAALGVILAGCASLKDLGAENHRVAECHAKPGQIDFHDTRTGYPLLSKAHPSSCEVAPDGSITWKDENESAVDEIGGDVLNEAVGHFSWGPGF